jgi:hypothetical protein
MTKKNEMLLIGRKEDINLPDLKLKGLNAKVDTGAYTSSMHCHLIQVIQEKGKEVLKFRLLDPEHSSYQKRTFVFSNFKRKRVKSSNGGVEQRYMIQTNIEIYGKVFKTEFTLTDRSDMNYPILLGRKFLRQGFIVDVSKYDVASKSSEYKVKIQKVKK